MAHDEVSVTFRNFWQGYQDDKAYTFLTQRLLADTRIKLVETEADIAFGSVFGSGELPGRIRCLFLGENFSADFSRYNFSVSHHQAQLINGCHNLTWPLFAIYYDLASLQSKPELDKSKFCAFVVSNPNCRVRNEFFDSLSRYRKVDSGGRYRNNLGYSIEGIHSEEGIIDFLRDYRFNIAFENSSSPYYCTEKIAQSMAAGTVPIYWGDPVVDTYFNPQSFIWAQDQEAAIRQVCALDQDPQAYAALYAQPWLQPGTLELFSDDKLAAFRAEMLSCLG